MKGKENQRILPKKKTDMRLRRKQREIPAGEGFVDGFSGFWSRDEEELGQDLRG